MTEVGKLGVEGGMTLVHCRVFTVRHMVVKMKKHCNRGKVEESGLL